MYFNKIEKMSKSVTVKRKHIETKTSTLLKTEVLDASIYWDDSIEDCFLCFKRNHLTALIATLPF